MNAVIPVTQTLPKKKVNLVQVGLFVGLTFLLTWSLDLVLYLNGGLESPIAILVLQLQMLLPAFSAMLLGYFFFKDSPIHHKTNKTTSRWFIWFFFLFTLVYIAAVVVAFIRPYDISDINQWMLILSILGLILLVVLRIAGKKESFSSVGMGGGKFKYWVIFGIGIILYSGLQTLLNWLFKLGTPVDLSIIQSQAAMSRMTVPVFMVVGTLQTLILGPLLGLVITFGEEYGWRGFLQPSLTKIGRVKGVIIVGIIWGIWHWPVIWMGYNYPNHPILGSFLFVLNCIGLAFILGYSVFKSKGVWIAAFLHATFNQSFSYFMSAVYTPKDMANSFGIGWPGMILLAVVVGLLLLDPVWKQSDE